ncbi:hypothetical protein [Cyclonatronum proteinivorum]|nr:hypothetical protein [Cyclonatronum proteinivorum]
MQRKNSTHPYTDQTGAYANAESGPETSADNLTRIASRFFRKLALLQT